MATLSSSLATLAVGIVSAPLLFGAQPSANRPSEKPNIIVIFADDMGYGDWRGGGHPTIKTPNMDRLAREGVTMTQFYSGCSVCTPSRAALLTGRNYIRTGMIGVLGPNDERGLPPHEITIADQLKSQGYRTACIGKWHLGSAEAYRPRRQGFEYYYGMLHSNNQYDDRLFRNEELIEDPVDQSTLTKRYTEEAISFIERSGNSPFFLYLPHTMPHVPVYASAAFKGKSRNGIYGDSIEEIDWGLGEIMRTLERRGIDRNTLVIFTSDNGPAMYKPVPRGSSGLFRGCKGDTWEGGMRVPFIARMPGRLPAGSIVEEVGSVIDIFPTCMELAGIPMPPDRPYDGMTLLPLFAGGTRGERTVYYYKSDQLHAVRHGKWKLHFDITEYSGGDYHLGRRTIRTLDTPLLFDLELDPSERYDVAAEHPSAVRQLTELAAAYRREIAARNENADLIHWFKTDYRKNERRLSPDN
jgi:arylsulfatase A